MITPEVKQMLTEERLKTEAWFNQIDQEILNDHSPFICVGCREVHQRVKEITPKGCFCKGCSQEGRGRNL
jgi:hypothetical protein